jgi:inorganic pyrophosphatase
MNDKALELNADERDHLAKLLAMDINDMRDTHIEAIKARADYLTDEIKARLPFLSEVKSTPKVGKKSAPIVAEDSSQN